VSEHEIRFALVMNGGVSLAVWMGGVTHELDLIRRATADGGGPPSREYDQPVAARWKTLMRPDGGVDQRRLVIDVVAGTSAGGLNGSMLATVIANGTTLDPAPSPVDAGNGAAAGSDQPEVRGPWLRQRWSVLGALEVGKLLPADDTSTKPESVLNGAYFLDQLGELLHALAESGSADSASTVTLFTPASGLGRQMFLARDAADEPFEVADHRFLYKFSNEHPRVYEGGGNRFSTSADAPNPFADTATLARASRASASFPAAFAPVRESPEMLSRPPRERPRTDQPESWLVDGGVLDNAPFGPVLDVVARRPVGTRATRYVVYVVPSSGIGSSTTAVRSDEAPPNWRTATMSAFQYPREVDFRGDVEELERLLLEADAAWSDSQRLFDRAVADPAERERVGRAAEYLQPTYVRGRAAGGVWEAITVSQSNQTTVLDMAAALTEQDVDAIIATKPTWVPASHEPVIPVTGGPDGTPLWPWGIGPAERVTRLVLRSLRRRLDERPADADATSVPSIAELESWLRTSSDTLQNILAVRDALTAPIKDKHLTARDRAADVAKAVNDVFDEWQLQEALGGQIASLQAGIPGGKGLVETALAVEVVSRCTSARAPDQRSAPFKFVRLGPDVGLPMLKGTTAEETARKLGDRILYGTQVSHFGAFGAADWRRWDWLMGRLHAVSHLGALLNEEANAEQWVGETQKEVLAAEGWTMEQFADRLDKLLADFPPNSGPKAMASMVNDLNTTAQGRATIISVVDRLIAVSGLLGRHTGSWTPVVAARSLPAGGSSGVVRGLARWLTEPARTWLWRRLTPSVTLEPTSTPLLASPWPGVAAVVLAIVLLTVATALPGGWDLALAALAGVVVACAAALVTGRVLLGRLRKALANRAERRVTRRFGG
jgi:patatin-related protein